MGRRLPRPQTSRLGWRPYRNVVTYCPVDRPVHCSARCGFRIREGAAFRIASVHGVFLVPHRVRNATVGDSASVPHSPRTRSACISDSSEGRLRTTADRVPRPVRKSTSADSASVRSAVPHAIPHRVPHWPVTTPRPQRTKGQPSRPPFGQPSPSPSAASASDSPSTQAGQAPWRGHWCGPRLADATR